MEIKIREVNREWAVDLETSDKIQSIYFKSRQNALSFVKYLELADNVIELDKKELQATITNYDHIRAMNIEEMATTMLEKFCFNCMCCPASDFCNETFEGKTCSDIVKKWLESEATE